MTRTVILTGASSGVGKATAQLLTQHGLRVVGLDIKEPDFPLPEFHSCDLSRADSIDAVLRKLDGRYASVMNVAGVPMSIGDELTVKVNFLGLRHFTDGIWERIEDRGTVVNVTSLAANNWRKRRKELGELVATPSFEAGLDWYRAHAKDFEIDSYMLSKEAVALYTTALAGRGLDRGIHANAVAPGPVETPLLPAFTKDAGEESLRTYIGMVGRVGRAQDIAEAIAVLAERKMGWVNGVHLNVDGGLTVGLSQRWKQRDGSMA